MLNYTLVTSGFFSSNVANYMFYFTIGTRSFMQESLEDWNVMFENDFDVHFDLKFYANGWSLSNALLAGINMHINEPSHLGQIYCGLEDVCTGATMVHNVYGKFMIDSVSAPGALLDPVAYPLYATIATSDVQTCAAVIQFCLRFGWLTVAEIYDSADWGAQMHASLVASSLELVELRLTYSTLALMSDNTELLVDVLVDSPTRIVIHNAQFYEVNERALPVNQTYLRHCSRIKNVNYQHIWPMLSSVRPERLIEGLSSGVIATSLTNVDLYTSRWPSFTSDFGRVYDQHISSWSDIVWQPWETVDEEEIDNSIALNPYMSNMVLDLGMAQGVALAYDCAEYAFSTIHRMLQNSSNVSHTRIHEISDAATLTAAFRSSENAFVGVHQRWSSSDQGGTNIVPIVGLFPANADFPDGQRSVFFWDPLLSTLDPVGAPEFLYNNGQTSPGADTKPPMQPDLSRTVTTDSATVQCSGTIVTLRDRPILNCTLTVDDGRMYSTGPVIGGVSEFLVPVVQGVEYKMRCSMTTVGGVSPAAEISVTASNIESCSITGCGENAICQPDLDVCECAVSYASPVEPILVTRACKELFSPCSTSGGCLGGYGTCNALTGICNCASGTEIAELPPGTAGPAITDAFIAAGGGSSGGSFRTCVLAVASTDDTRKFWTISLWLSAWGLLVSMWVLWEFIYNQQLRHPNTMMQAFIAFAIPDLLLSLMNFVVYMDSLVDGNPLGSATGEGGRDDDGCLTISFLMYVIVLCTYFAPTVVALVTFLKFNAVSQGKASFSLPSALVYSLAFVGPATFGSVLAGMALNTQADDDQSVLGSYRGLYCYVRRWDDGLTGLVIIMMFCLSATATVLLYLLTTLKVAAVVKNASSASAAKAPRALMKRGLMLTATFVCTWIWFVTTGGLAYNDEAIDIDYDIIGAIILNAQPIIDGFILLTLPNIRLEYLSRWLKQAGGSVSSSSSS